MDNLSEDQKVVDLLTKLKNSNGGYPSDMLAARRRSYLKQVANAGLGIGIGAGLKHAAKGGRNGAGAAPTTVASKILETVLIAAIAIEAGTVTFLYRDKIATAVRSYVNGPTVQEVSSPPHETSSADSTLIEAFVTPSVTISATPSTTPSATPSTSVAGGNGPNNGNNNGGTNTGVNAEVTPNPGGNQGNQYGLTPKPERTKENNGGSDNSDTGGDGGGSNNNGNGAGNNNRP